MALFSILNLLFSMIVIKSWWFCSELQNSYPQLTSLRSLKSVVPLPRDGDDGESPVAITSAPSVPETSFVHSPVQLEKLDKIHGDGKKLNSNNFFENLKFRMKFNCNFFQMFSKPCRKSNTYHHASQQFWNQSSTILLSFWFRLRATCGHWPIRS